MVENWNCWIILHFWISVTLWITVWRCFPNKVWFVRDNRPNQLLLRRRMKFGIQDCWEMTLQRSYLTLCFISLAFISYCALVINTNLSKLEVWDNWKSMWITILAVSFWSTLSITARHTKVVSSPLMINQKWNEHSIMWRTQQGASWGSMRHISPSVHLMTKIVPETCTCAPLPNPKILISGIHVNQWG